MQPCRWKDLSTIAKDYTMYVQGNYKTNNHISYNISHIHLCITRAMHTALTADIEVLLGLLPLDIYLKKVAVGTD